MKEISKVKEFSGDNTHRTIKELVGKEVTEKEKILRYLKSFDPDCAAGMVLVDEITREEVGNGVEGYDDGVYYWDTREIYHFEKYNMELQKDFIDYVMNM